MEPSFEFQQLLSAVQRLYHLTAEAILTMKWIDDEGDPCMLTSDAELNEAIRLYQINKEPFLTIHGRSLNLYVFFHVCIAFDAIVLFLP